MKIWIIINCYLQKYDELKNSRILNPIEELNFFSSRVLGFFASQSPNLRDKILSCQI